MAFKKCLLSHFGHFPVLRFPFLSSRITSARRLISIPKQLSDTWHESCAPADRRKGRRSAQETVSKTPDTHPFNFVRPIEKIESVHLLIDTKRFVVFQPRSGCLSKPGVAEERGYPGGRNFGKMTPGGVLQDVDSPLVILSRHPLQGSIDYFTFTRGSLVPGALVD
jgi:hypothetical protein